MRRAHKIRPNPTIRGGWAKEGAGSARRAAFGGCPRAGMYAVEEMRSAHSDARKLVEDEGIAIRLLNCGTFACAYELLDHPGWVLKITGDVTEAAAWANVLLREARASGLPELAMVFALPPIPLGKDGVDCQLYAIVVELLEPLAPINPRMPPQFSEQEAATRFVDPLPSFLRDDASPEVTAHVFERGVERAVDGLGWDSDFERQARAFAPTISTLYGIGVVVEDLGTTGNVMKDRQDRWKIADMGIARAPEVWVPDFEWGLMAGEIADSIADARQRRPKRPAKIANPAALRRRLTRR